MKKIILCSITFVFLLQGFSQSLVPDPEGSPPAEERVLTQTTQTDSGTIVLDENQTESTEYEQTFIEKSKATTESGNFDENASAYFSSAYPNPANNEVSIDYEINDPETAARFVIYNLLGKIVIEAEISDLSGSLSLNTSDLNEGIYFYSLLIRNDPTRTQKLIIKH